MIKTSSQKEEWIARAIRKAEGATAVPFTGKIGDPEDTRKYIATFTEPQLKRFASKHLGDCRVLTQVGGLDIDQMLNQLRPQFASCEPISGLSAKQKRELKKSRQTA